MSKKEKNMKRCVKPIQPTPTLSGKDAKQIVDKALTMPSNQSIKRNEERLAISRKVFKE